ncbi:MAG: PKD domain-containing protein [Thermoplasmata archaeon]|nr:PKD domain-containing protein [Thermoplasmata archaeon]
MGKVTVLGTSDDPVLITNNSTTRWRRFYIRGDNSSISDCIAENGEYLYHILNCRNVSFNNISIRQARDGIFIDRSNNISIENVEGFDLFAYGFRASYSDDVSISNLTLFDSYFSLYGCNRCSVDGGYYALRNYGIGNSHEILFTNLTFIHNVDGGPEPLVIFEESTVEMHRCNLLAAAGQMLNVRLQTSVNASGNYWGIADVDQIRERILIEDTSTVDISNPLDAPVPLNIPVEWTFINGSVRWSGDRVLTGHIVVNGNLTIEKAKITPSNEKVPPFLYVLGRMDISDSVLGNTTNRVHMAYGPLSTGDVTDSSLYVIGTLPMEGSDMVWENVLVDCEEIGFMPSYSNNLTIIGGTYSPYIRPYRCHQISFTDQVECVAVVFTECFDISISNIFGIRCIFKSCRDINIWDVHLELSDKVTSYGTVSNISIENLTAHTKGDTIVFERAENVVIRNSSFDASVVNGSMGIYFRFGASNVTFENVDLKNTNVRTEVTFWQENYTFRNIIANESSLRLTRIVGVWIHNSTFFFRTGDILILSHCKDVELLDIIVLQGEGPWLGDCHNVTIKRFHFTKTFAYGLQLDGCSEVELEDGYISGSVWSLWADCNGTIKNLTLRGGFPLTMFKKMRIENLTVIGGEIGIRGVCYASTFINCTVTGTRSWPLHLRGVTNAKFFNCTFGGGVWIEQGSKVLMENCTTGGLNAQVSRSIFRYGVVSNGNSDFWSGNVIENCTFVNSSRSVRLVGDRCLVTHCTFSGTSTSIRVEGDSSVVYHNEIDGVINVVGYNNLFFFNNILLNYPPDLSTPSQWDNGSHGNYWRIYTGTDRNGDGIGDTPFVIKVGNVDNYPLIDPLDLEYPIANAGPDVVVPQHTRVTLWAANSTDNDAISRYRWTFEYGGGTVNRSGVVFTFLFDDAGVYVVTLSVEDNWFNVARDRVRVTVLDTDLPTLVSDRTPAETTTGSTLVFNLTAMDNMGVSSVIIEWWQGNGSVTVVLTTHEGNGTYLASIRVPLNSTEDINYQVQIADLRSNEFVSDERSVRVVDVFPPYVVDLGYSGPTTGDGWTFWVEGSDNIAVVGGRLEYSIDGSSTETHVMDRASDSRFEGSLTVPPGATGKLRFRLVVVDGEGLEASSDWTEVPIVDNDLPVVEDRTAGPATTGDELVLSALIIENVGVELAWCEWEVDGEVGNTSMDGTGEVLTATVELTDTPDGVVRYRFGALDTSGLVKLSQWHELNILDNDSPEARFIDPPTSHERGTTLTLAVEAMDNDAVASVSVILIAIDQEYSAVKGDGGTWTVEIPAEALSGSSVEFTIMAVDRTLNEGLGGPLRLELVDTTPPEGAFHLEPDTPTTGDNLDILGEVYDVSGVSTLDVEYVFGTDEVETERLLVGDDGTFVLRIGVPNSPLGALRVRLVLEDTEGNVHTTEWREWQVVDNDAPVAKTHDDAESRVGERFILDDGGSSDNVEVVNWTWSWNEGGKARVVHGKSVTLRFDREGEYMITLKVTDAAGNTDEATLRVVVSDVSSPISGVLIAVIVAACIIAVAITYVILKRKRGIGE